jgi:hypothetical protein
MRVLEPLDLPLPDTCAFSLRPPIGLGGWGLFVKVLLCLYIAVAGMLVVTGLALSAMAPETQDRWADRLARHWPLVAALVPVTAVYLLRRTVGRHLLDRASLWRVRGRELLVDSRGFRIAHAFVGTAGAGPYFGVPWDTIVFWHVIRRRGDDAWISEHVLRLRDGRTLRFDRRSFVDSDRFFLELARRRIAVPIELHGIDGA